MTASSGTSPNETCPDSSVPLSEAIRAAVESGKDVRDRVRDVVVSLFRSGETSAASARAAVSGIVQSATEIVKRSAPENPESVLRNVIDGVTTGLATVAQSTQYAVQEATARGQRFASQDLDRAKKDLSGIGDILLDTVKYFSNRVTEEAGSAATELKTHAERSVAAVTPVLKSSVEAVAKHPVQTAGEAAETAIRTAQLTAGALLGAMSGLLSSAADALDPKRQKSSAANIDTAVNATVAAADGKEQAS
jgi:polyhydroxyalkanoate synthesis regulator phasin